LFGEDSVYVLLGTALISAVAKLTAVFTLAVGCKLRKGKLYSSPQGIEAVVERQHCVLAEKHDSPSSNDRTAERGAFGISLPDSPPHSGTEIQFLGRKGPRV
jgi:hypothetical protein